MNNYKKIRNIPIRIALLFSLFTFLLYIIGPYQFPSNNRFILIIFLIVTNISMYAGFNKGSSVHVITSTNRKPVRINRLINIVFLISFILSVPRFIIYTGFYSDTINNTIQSALLFFSGAVQEVYNNKFELSGAVGIWKYINYFVVLLGPIYWAYIPIGLYYWKRLKIYQKVVSIFIWMLNILQYICTGTNVGFFEFIVIFFGIYAIKHMSNKKSNRKLFFGALLLIFSVILIFDFTMGSRIGDNYQYLSLPNQYCEFNENSFILKFTPSFLHPVIAYFTRYLAIPYYALDLSFDIPFKSTFGLGHSWFILDNIGPFSSMLWERTYMMQMESQFSYDHFSNWHTAYLWFANDVSHFGVPIIFYFLFYLFGKSWKEYLCTRNLVSLLIFILFIILVLFISANNHIFQPSHLLFLFWILLFLRKYSRKFIWPVE